MSPRAGQGAGEMGPISPDSPSRQAAGAPTHTSYALLSSPCRPKYLSENADAGHRQRKAGYPGRGCAEPQMRGRPLAGQMLLLRHPSTCGFLPGEADSTALAFEHARVGGRV